jgi:Flp pilus assembly protein CpaB
MKNKLPLIVAILFGLAAVLTVKSYIGKTEGDLRAKAQGIAIVATRVDVPANTVLSQEMLMPVSLPRGVGLQQSYAWPAELGRIVGTRTAVAIPKNQVLLASHLVVQDKGFSKDIPMGGQAQAYRAYTASFTRGIRPGLVRVGDHIDILSSFALPKAADAPGGVSASSWRQTSDMVNVVLLQNVEILAVGETFGTNARGEGGTDLTLALTLPEAQELMFAAQHGDLGAVLRRAGSIEVLNRTNLPRITFQDVERIIGDLDRTRNVEVEKGRDRKTYAVPLSGSEAGATGSSEKGK